MAPASLKTWCGLKKTFSDSNESGKKFLADAFQATIF